MINNHLSHKLSVPLVWREGHKTGNQRSSNMDTKASLVDWGGIWCFNFLKMHPFSLKWTNKQKPLCFITLYIMCLYIPSYPPPFSSRTYLYWIPLVSVCVQKLLLVRGKLGSPHNCHHFVLSNFCTKESQIMQQEQMLRTNANTTSTGVHVEVLGDVSLTEPCC